jgi:hypothetical protein
VTNLSRTPRRTYLASVAALAAFDARARLSEVRCPTLVVAGDRHRMVARDATEALARGIPGAGFVLVPDAGHATTVDEAASWGVYRFCGIDYLYPSKYFVFVALPQSVKRAWAAGGWGAGSRSSVSDREHQRTAASGRR